MTTLYRVPTADGRYLYPISDLPRSIDAWTVASGPVDVVTHGGTYNAQKFLAAGDVPSVTYTTRSSGELLGYRLGRKVPGATEQISVAEYEELDDDAQDLYSQVRGDDVITEHTIDLTGFVNIPVDVIGADMMADPAPELEWQPGLPYIVYGPGLAHVLPGNLVRVRKLIAERVKGRLPHVTVYTHDADKGLVHGTVALRFEDNRTYPVKDGRRTRQAPSTQTFKFEFPLPLTIAGKTKAEALAALDQHVDTIVSSIEDVRPVVCAHCDGKGVVPSKNLEPKA